MFSTSAFCPRDHATDVLLDARVDSGTALDRPCGECGATPIVVDNVRAFERGQRESSAAAAAGHRRDNCQCHACFVRRAPRTFDPRARRLYREDAPQPPVRPCRRMPRVAGYWSPTPRRPQVRVS